MSQLDRFLAYLTQVNEGTLTLTQTDYSKICTIRDQITDLAKKFTTFNQNGNLVVKAEPGYGRYRVAASELDQIDDIQTEVESPRLEEYTILKYEDFVNEMIVKSGDKWLVKDKKGKKVLGTHPSRKKAIAQLRAIEISKAGR